MINNNYWCFTVDSAYKKGLQKNNTIYKFGERGSGLRPRGEPQDFQQIRATCLRNGQLFEDPEFPALDSSIFYSRNPPKPFEWKRPHELCENPRLFVEGASRFDVRQGELGDCWLLAAVANLTLNHSLFVRVVPDDQSFVEDYAGVFHFRFWQYGKWVDVVIDDRLPTYYGRLVFMHSNEQNEFWSALLEKAYAKLHGSYEALKGGTTCEAMEDFTGGVTEVYDLQEKAPPNLFHIMLKAYERSSLMGCSLEADPNVCEAELPNGLIRGHAYSLTRVKFVDIKTPNTTGKIQLVRIRNPWGNEAEWKGPWSDKSPEWRFIPDGEKQELGLTFEADGEFWMAYKDFINHFQKVEVCNLNPDSLDDEVDGCSHKKWEASVFEGGWTRGLSAGGCRNYLDTFWHNPQYRITLEDPDDDDDDDDDKGNCTIIVALMQKNRRTMRKMGVECLTIGFALYKVSDPNSAPTPMDKNFFKCNTSVARSPTFINMREITSRFKLPPGTYCIVPSTFEPNEEGDFVLRVFTEKKSDVRENDDEVGMQEPEESGRHKPSPAPSVPKVPTPNVRARGEPSIESKDAMKAVFKKISGEDMEVDYEELKQVLDIALKKDFAFDGFSMDVCRSMVAMMDVDRSGKLGFDEFVELWKDVITWKNVFKSHDKDGGGRLNTFELRGALTQAGYKVNYHILRVLVMRYGRKDGTLTFDDFITCAVKLKSMIEIFRDKDTQKRNEASFSLEEWIEKTMYA